MKHLYKIIIFFAFSLLSLPAFSLDERSVFSAIDNQDTEISVSGNKIYITNLPVAGKLQIYSILGVNIASIDVKAGTNEYSVNLPKGYYIVKVGDIVRKVAVK
ncbi:MAG: T9SS type A sorting domain-containing protein [Dysgonamonadaceae bacterium]